MYECHVLLSRLGFQGASHSSSYSIEHSLFVLIVKQEQKSLRIFKKKSFVDVQILMKIEFFWGRVRSFTKFGTKRLMYCRQLNMHRYGGR